MSRIALKNVPFYRSVFLCIAPTDIEIDILLEVAKGHQAWLKTLVKVSLVSFTNY